MFRHQLPVFSPVPLQALISALRGAPQDGADPLPALSEVLSEERGAERAILYGSGTQALQVALRVAVDSVGGDVALPAYSCFDVATAAVAARVPVRFYFHDDVFDGIEVGPFTGELQPWQEMMIKRCVDALGPGVGHSER